MYGLYLVSVLYLEFGCWISTGMSLCGVELMKGNARVASSLLLGD